MERFVDAPPAFAVTAVPVSAEDAEITVSVLCTFLLEVSLDDMRTALQKKGYARGMSRRRGPVQMEVALMTGPIDLGIIVGGHSRLNIVRISPKSFDRTVPQQELVYRKCVGMLEIFSTAPVGKTAHRIAVGPLVFGYNATEADRQSWVRILRRWEAK